MLSAIALGSLSVVDFANRQLPLSMFIALILFVGLLPAVLSLLVAWLTREPFETELQLAASTVADERLRFVTRRPRHPDEHYVEGMGLVIGDITCQLNAKSPYIRCAANPSGPCEGCREYEGRDYD
ncbi:MAG: DUF6464 family protein [Phormidesmis sp.]